MGFQLFHSSSPFSIVFLQSTIAFLSGIFLTVPKQPLLLALSYNNPIPHYCFHSLFLFFRLIEAWGPQLGAGGSTSSLSTQLTPRSWSTVPSVSACAVCHCRRGSPCSPTSIVYLLCRSRRNLSKCRAAMNQVFDANKKQPHGTKHLGALQAKKEKKKEKNRKRCSCEEYKYWLLEEPSILYPLLQSTYLFRANALHFEIVMDLLSHPQGRSMWQSSAGGGCRRSPSPLVWLAELIAV